VRVDERRRSGDVRRPGMADGDLSMFGTDTDTFRADVTQAIDAIVAAHAGDRIVVVNHAGIINAYLGGVLGIERLQWVGIAYGGACRMDASRAGVRSILPLNERAHGCGLRSSRQRDPANAWPGNQQPDVVESVRQSGGFS
jgi:broad specificity phosphatase PhoE